MSGRGQQAPLAAGGFAISVLARGQDIASAVIGVLPGGVAGQGLTPGLLGGGGPVV